MHKTTNHGKRQFLAGFVVLVASVLLASAAQAQHVYPLAKGIWSRGDGVDVDVPFVGKAVDNCDFLVQGQNKVRPDGQEMTNFPTMHPSVYAGFEVNIAANYGCLSGTTPNFNATAHATGAQFTLPPLFISRPFPGMLVAVPIQDAPALVQAATSGLWQVPNATRGMGDDAIGAMTVNNVMLIGPTMAMPPNCVEATCTNLAQFRRFREDAWSTQTGRAGPDFTWCPGDQYVVPPFSYPCTTINQNPGGDGRIIKYKAGPNRFGGTIAQIVDTGGNPGSLFIEFPNKVDVQILDAGQGAIQALGRGYADFLTDSLPAATMAFTMVTVNTHYKATLMKSVPLIVGVGDPTPPQFPMGTNQKYGFPLTTGTVVVRNTNLPNIGNDVITITGMGYDKLLPQTTGGAPTPSAMSRNISLVAGSLSNLAPLGINTSGMGQLFLPEPSGAGSLLAGAAILFAVAGWRARRGRKSTRA